MQKYSNITTFSSYLFIFTFIKKCTLATVLRIKVKE